MNNPQDTCSTALRSKLLTHGLSLYSRVSLQGSFVFESPVTVYSECVLQNVSLGAYSYVNACSRLCTTAMGRYCSIGDGVNIGLIRHELHGLTTSPAVYDNDTFSFAVGRLPLPYPSLSRGEPLSVKITMGHDVWVGAGVTIPSEINIGTGAVIGAASVVTHDVPPYAIVAGNPARLIRYRFKEELIADLLGSQWWNYDWPRLRKTQSIPMDDAAEFMSFFKALDPSQLPVLEPHYLSLKVEGPERCSLSRVAVKR